MAHFWKNAYLTLKTVIFILLSCTMLEATSHGMMLVGFKKGALVLNCGGLSIDDFAKICIFQITLAC